MFNHSNLFLLLICFHFSQGRSGRNLQGPEGEPEDKPRAYRSFSAGPKARKAEAHLHHCCLEIRQVRLNPNEEEEEAL